MIGTIILTRMYVYPTLLPMVRAGPMTAEELLQLSMPDKRTELVRGVLMVREPAAYRHGEVAARLLMRIGAHVSAHDLGRVFAAETGFKLAPDPDTVRAPDVAFIRKERLPAPPPRGFAAIAPDLVVEVLSPDDRAGEVLAKVGDWLSAGAVVVWVVDPERRRARVYGADGEIEFVGPEGELDGEDVLPGFTLSLAEVL